MASRRFIYVFGTLSMVLGAFGHGDDEMASHSDGSHVAQETQTPGTYPATYFTLDTHQLEIRAHVILMIISWFILLPIATMLSLAKSRYTHFVRLGLTATNVIGVLFGASYKAKTPDMYPGSVHSAVGWIVTCIAAAQMSHLLVHPITKLFSRATGQDKSDTSGYEMPPMRENFNSPQDDEAQPGRLPQASFDVEATHVGIEDRAPSSYARVHQEDQHESAYTSGDETFYGESESDPALHHGTTWKMLPRPILAKTRRLILFIYGVIDRAILIVAFVAFCTGIVTFWGLFKEQEIFNGLAHWIKGGIFLWLGIFSLGRWCGCFADMGWAWNARPGGSRRPSWLSSEFVESSLIFFYGSTNIFLEHLAGWGKPWSARDLEHVAITVLFIGGGLCGILVEYVRVKGLGEKKARQQMQTMSAWSSETTDERAEHRSNGISINPLPALVIFVMGGSMSSHQQASMVSTMVHKQWGNLLGAASVARLVTYIIMYMKPPTSTSPSHPPTELLMSFCLISGGTIFMASSRDTIDGMIHFGVDPMALYTVTMGFTGILMAWIIVLLALKDRASR